jgi:predicted kinase
MRASTKKMVIFRGPSGCGKSTTAKRLFALQDAVVVSADDFWYDDDGNYNFDRERLSEAHAACRRRAQEALDKGVAIVAVDNTNMRWWEFLPYIDMARAAGYDVELFNVWDPRDLALYAERNTKGLLLVDIIRQASNFQRWDKVDSGYNAMKAHWFIDEALRTGDSTFLFQAYTFLEAALAWSKADK